MVSLTVTTMANGATPDRRRCRGPVRQRHDRLDRPFDFYGGNIPVGYYDPAEGLLGTALQSALHGIIDNHSSISYDNIWTAFYTTDDKPNGYVWDMYSDVPGGTPPYDYTFGVDQGGTAGTEGTGYNREHSWPSSWYGATSPMYTDLFMVYPTDNEVNNRRGSYPFGEVTSPTWTSLTAASSAPAPTPLLRNGLPSPSTSTRATSPARTSTWPPAITARTAAGPAADDRRRGAVAWAEAMLLEWHYADPVSAKEIDRNEAVYAIQNNRNPFIDRPDFVPEVFTPELVDVLQQGLPAAVVLLQNAPNPFNPSTTISYELENAARVDLKIYDMAGRLVKTLYRGEDSAGRHEQVWRGRDESGRSVAAGAYIYRLDTGKAVETRRMMLVK